ncbi:MAG: AAA family ATPase [Clostridia bacterium]|nr:AAA family ATPase [Clostridia bacterium]
MKLKMFRVQNFRSFSDSGWITCQDITAVTGVNEAGKSNLLKALWKLKPAFQTDNKILNSDLPRDRIDELMDAERLPEFVSAKFKLETRDLSLLRKYFPTIHPFDFVTITRTLSGKYFVDVPVVVPEEKKEKLNEFIIKIMPGFIYYSNYGNLDSNIYLPQMLSSFNKKGVNALTPAKKRTIKLLLMYVGITPEMLKEDLPLLFSEAKNEKLTSTQLSELTKKKEEYQKLFDNAGIRLSQEFSEMWRQGDYKFQFIFEGDSLEILVTDSMGNSAPLEERSVGMQWFLSFFLVFSLESRLFYTNTILLLDESGMTLHGLAQQDLVHFMEQLSQKNQIVYTTHSSFMIPTEHLNRAKVVYKDKFGHSMVSNELKLNKEQSNKASLLPVQSAVGIEVSRSILNSCDPIIVMSESDQYLLTTMKNYLTGRGKIKTNNDVVFVSAGINGVDGIAQILSEDSELPKVFLSDLKTTEKVFKYLTSNTYFDEQKKIIKLSDFGKFETLEDVIPYELFARAAGSYLIRILDANFELETGKPFICQVEEYAKQNDYTLPANYRDEIAKRIKSFISKNFKEIKIDRPVKKLWINIVEKLI